MGHFVMGRFLMGRFVCESKEGLVGFMFGYNRACCFVLPTNTQTVTSFLRFKSE
jgi:hypothetical protein